MSALLSGFNAAGVPAVARLCKITRLATLPVIAILLASCTDAPRSPVAGPDPADPGARAPRVDYRSTIGSYKSQRPVSPGPWREQNEQVTPAPKSGQ
jgi:hypothetical protein